jgi:hypothetical protein
VNIVSHVFQTVLSGDESKAIANTKENLEAWKVIPRALDWLPHQTK